MSDIVLAERTGRTESALMRPDSLAFNCHIGTANFGATVRLFLELMRQQALPPIVGWQSADVEDGSPADLAGAVSNLPDSMAGAGDRPVFLGFDCSGSVLGNLKLSTAANGEPFCSANLQWITTDRDGIAELVAFQNSCLALCRGLFSKADVHFADLRPEGGGARCIPEVPLVDGNSHVALASRANVADAYDDPEVFWAAGWKVVESRGDRHLLARDMDVVGGPDYLARIMDHQWAMARAARAHRTRYDRPLVAPEDERLFKAGEARLQSVGYSKAEGLLEYSCALEAGEHIRGWEIYALLNVIKRGQLSDGPPVKTVRIVFLDAWAAKQEKRPLLDIGCRVYHYDAQGELVELRD